jgi:hypothetical protein
MKCIYTNYELQIGDQVQQLTNVQRGMAKVVEVATAKDFLAAHPSHHWGDPLSSDHYYWVDPIPFH